MVKKLETGGRAAKADLRTQGAEDTGHRLYTIRRVFSWRMKTCFVVLSLYSFMSVLAMGWPG